MLLAKIAVSTPFVAAPHLRRRTVESRGLGEYIWLKQGLAIQGRAARGVLNGTETFR